MNPLDARELGLNEGDSITLEGTAQGDAAITMAIALSDSLPRGMLFCPYFDQSSLALVSLPSDGSGADAFQVRTKKES